MDILERNQNKSQQKFLVLDGNPFITSKIRSFAPPTGEIIQGTDSADLILAKCQVAHKRVTEFLQICESDEAECAEVIEEIEVSEEIVVPEESSFKSLPGMLLLLSSEFYNYLFSLRKSESINDK